MSLLSFLVVGGGPQGCAVAGALARRGAEVSVIESTAARLQPDAIAALQSLGVDVRLGLVLVGVIDVGTHLEAELSNDHVENYDGIVLADADTTARIGAGVRGVSVVDDDTDGDREAARLVRPQRAG